MKISRKTFLKTLTTGGLGIVLHPLTGWAHWHDRGVSLVHVQRQSLVMGSIISFDVVAESQKDGYEAIRKALDIFRALESKLSMYRSDSEATRLGQQAGKNPVRLSPETLDVLQFSREMSIKTNDHFDITLEPAMRSWGFRKDPGVTVNPPTDREIRKLKKRIGSDKLEIESGQALLKEPGMAIDLGGIAGGYALDKAIATMKKEPIKAAFINFSGDIHCFGKPEKGESWGVHLVDPSTLEPLTDRVELNDEALSTSGSYQNRRNDGHGHSWGHLLSPQLVRPVEPIGSVTAIHPSAMQADAWSTATYVGAQPDKNVKIIRLQKD